MISKRRNLMCSKSNLGTTSGFGALPTVEQRSCRYGRSGPDAEVCQPEMRSAAGVRPGPGSFLDQPTDYGWPRDPAHQRTQTYSVTSVHAVSDSPLHVEGPAAAFHL